jgi:hypothetical protein
MAEKTRTTLYLPKELKDKVMKKAEKDKRSFSATIELLIEESLSQETNKEA